LNWFKRLLFLSFFFSALACHQVSRHIAPHTPAQEGVLPGQYIPYFELPDPTGKQVSVETKMGKATLIDFWASWCRPCREAANPVYKKLYQKYHRRGLNIIGVSTDRHTYFWKKALRQDSLSWFQLLDTTRRILKTFKVKSLPTLYLIDAHGKIVGRNLWGKILSQKVDSLLKK